MCRFSIVVFITIIAFVTSCKKDDVTPELTVTPGELSLNAEGDTSEISIVTNESWTIANAAHDWLALSQGNGDNGSIKIKVMVKENPSSSTRTAILVVNSSNGQARRITVTQMPTIYPSYNTSPKPPDATGMSSTAPQLASKIKVGWNLGNTLEAIPVETSWGNDSTSKELIDFIKASGFNAIRIPCSWNQYLENAETAKIKTEWLDHVKEIVQYCVDNDMYVILNIHWDGGWLQSNIVPEKEIVTNAKQKAFWEQIATHMRDFDEHLMFASANEPVGKTATEMKVLNSYHQTFINAVRSTGGHNSHRVLVIQALETSIDKAVELMTYLPKDQIENKLMVEVHYYDPWQFAGMTSDADWGKAFYYWGQGNHSTDEVRNASWGEESSVDERFKKMKTAFVDRGIPVVLGEYGAIRRTDGLLSGDALAKHLKSRADYIRYVTKQAIANGLLPFYWDEGSLGNHGFGFIDRKNKKVGDQQALDALMEGANQ